MPVSVNRVILIGYVGATPELKHSDHSGKTYTQFSVATNKTVYNGDSKEIKTTWHKINCFGKWAENACNYVKKGMQIYIDGELSNSEYVDRKGRKHFEIIIINPKMLYLSKKDEGDAQRAAGNDGDIP